MEPLWTLPDELHFGLQCAGYALLIFYILYQRIEILRVRRSIQTVIDHFHQEQQVNEQKRQRWRRLASKFYERLNQSIEV